MKKTALLLLLAGALPATAAQLTPAEALSRALGQPAAMRAARGVRPSAGEYTLRATEGSLYVFTRAGGGYLITPSDPNQRAVLAVSDSGTFDPATMPAAMKWLLGVYEAEASAAATATTGKVPDYYVGWEAVKPLVKARWGQGSPYNDRCPLVFGQRCATGCVATAMAQIIYTNRYARGKGKIRYQLYSDRSWQEFDFTTAKFDFDAMTDTYGDSSTPEACEAVAELMEACGKSVEMSYFPGESAATSDKVPDALVNRFGYDRNTRICNRWDYQTEQWETIIYNELTNGRPVYYSGSTESGGGHAFVCDGYDGNGLFHINWGWGSMSDGYFALTSLKPGQIGTGGSPGGFNTVQQIVLCLKPGFTGGIPDAEPDAVSGAPDLLVADAVISPMQAGKEMTLTFTLINRGTADLSTVSSRLTLLPAAGASTTPLALGDEVRSFGVPAGDAVRATFKMNLYDDKGRDIPAGKYRLTINEVSDAPLCASAVFDVEVAENDGAKEESAAWEWAQMGINDAGECIPGVMLRKASQTIVPSVRNDDGNKAFTIGLALFTPGTNECVWSDTQSITCQSTGGRYVGNFPYLKKYSITSVDPGVYEAAFVTDGNREISARRTVKVAERIGKITYAPDAAGTGAEVVRYTAGGDVVIAPEVTFENGTTLPVTGVDTEVFMDNSKISSIEFPETLTSLGLHSLRNLRKVETLRFKGTTVPLVAMAYAGYRMNPAVKIYVAATAKEAYAAAFAPYAVIGDDEAEDSIGEITANRPAAADATVYDLQGREVRSPRRGQIYISAGRKFRF